MAVVCCFTHPQLLVYEKKGMHVSASITPGPGGTLPTELAFALAVLRLRER
jgi:hypothetical protein